MNYCPMLPVVMAFATGIIIEYALPFPSAILELSIVVAMLLLYCSLHRSTRDWGWIYILLLLLGMWRCSHVLQSKAVTFSQERVLCRLRGRVVQAAFPLHWLPLQSEQARFACNWFIVETEMLWNKGRWCKAQMRVKVRFYAACPQYSRGDILQIYGWLYKIPEADNPGQYNQRLHWQAYGVTHAIKVVHPKNAIILQRNSGCPLLNFCSKVRLRYVEKLREVLGPNYGNFVAAIVLGSKRLLPRQTKELFSQAGLSHMLVISGLHISIVAFFLYQILVLLLLPLPVVALITGLCCILYAALVDLQTPVVRATIALCLYFAAIIVARRSNAVNCLATAAIFILWCAPLQLLTPGFQLSFAACLGILHWNKYAKNFRKIRRSHLAIFQYLGTALAISASAWMGIAPLIAFYFGSLPLSAPLFSVLCLPILTLLFALAFLLLFTPVGIGWGAWVLGKSLWACAVLLQRSAEIACAHTISLPVLPPPIAILLIFYLLFAISFIIEKTQLARLWILILLVLLSGQLRKFQQYDCGITMLAVGHGNAIYFKTPGNRHFLYDCGSITPGITRRVIMPFLRHFGVDSLDGVIISHLDSDHYNGLGELVTQIPIKRIFCNQDLYGSNHPLIQQMQSWHIPIKVVGNDYRPPQISQMQFLDPGAMLTRKNTNDNEYSLLLILKMHDFRILFTGDMGPQSLQILLKQKIGTIEILQVPHHGRKLPGTANLLAKLQPRWGLISSKRKLPISDTINSYRDCNISIVNTGDHGAIEIIFGKTGVYTVSCYRQR